MQERIQNSYYYYMSNQMIKNITDDMDYFVGLRDFYWLCFSAYFILNWVQNHLSFSTKTAVWEIKAVSVLIFNAWLTIGCIKCALQNTCIATSFKCFNSYSPNNSKSDQLMSQSKIFDSSGLRFLVLQQFAYPGIRWQNHSESWDNPVFKLSN